MGIPADLRIAGDLTPELLGTIRDGLGEPGQWDATVVAALVAKLDNYRARLTKAESDLLNVRGTLSPNGYPRRVPMELGPTLAPAVEWLAGEVDRQAGLLALALEYLVACPPPDIAHGWDLCPHGETWPCKTTRAAWELRGLDAEEQRNAAFAAVRAAWARDAEVSP